MKRWQRWADTIAGLVERSRGPVRQRLVGGHLVLPTGVTSTDLVIERGRMAAIGRDNTPSAYEQVIDVTGLLVLPGLINAHDHLEFNCFPRLGQPQGYTNFFDWGQDITRWRRSPVVDRVLQIPLQQRLRCGGYKNLFSGVTTVGHHGPYYWRHLGRRFPVKVLKRYGWCHSLRMSQDVAGSYRRTPPDTPWIIHLAEGRDDAARGELSQLAGLGCLGPNTVIVHGVGLSQADVDRLAQRQAGLIWCPASNLFMFGETAPIQALKGRVTIALGSDSRLSGSADLLAELKVARSLNLASDEELFYMVTRDAARLLRIDDRAGAIAPGKQADLLILAGNPRSPYESLVAARPDQLRLVLSSGRPVFGLADFGDLFRAWGQSCHELFIAGRPYLAIGHPAGLCLHQAASSI